RARGPATPGDPGAKPPGGGDMTGALIRVVNRISRVLPDERRHWVEALTAETVVVSGRRAQLGWILGGLALLARQMVVSWVRPVVWLVPVVLIVPAVLVPSVGPIPIAVTVLFGLCAAVFLNRHAPHGRFPVAVYAIVAVAAAAVAVLAAIVIR